MTASARLPRLKLLALGLVFAGPLLLATLVYFNPFRFTLPASVSHGELITPAQPLPAFDAVSRRGMILPGGLLSGRWTLLYWNGADCGLDCEADLFKMRQVRLSLSKDIERVQTVYFSERPADGARLDRLLGGYPGMIAAHPPPGAESALAGRLGAYPKKSIYIVDPNGNLMMRYSGQAASRGILKDLKKLLRASRIG